MYSRDFTSLYKRILKISNESARRLWNMPELYVEYSKLYQEYRKNLTELEEIKVELADLKSIIANMRPGDVERAKIQRDEGIERQKRIEKMINERKMEENEQK